MTVLVSIETVLLVLLVVLVAGLLRSHAEILRRLGPAGADEDAAREDAAREDAAREDAAREDAAREDAAAAPLPEPPAGARTGKALQPAPLAGVTPGGDPVTLAFDGATGAPTLLAFLTSGCSTCAGFWETLSEPRLPAGVQTVIVTHGSERERPAKLRSLAPEGVAVVMSSRAWSDYRVPGAPYFVLVDGGVRGEGVATSWQALASLVSDAIEDQAEAADGGTRRARTVDTTLAAAGIGPEHPSLYPGRSR